MIRCIVKYKNVLFFEYTMAELINIRDLVLNIVSVVAPDADLSNVKNDVRLREQIDMDSMDFLDVVMELRKRYKVEVPKEDYPKLATIDGCVEYLAPKFNAMKYTIVKE